jgi:uncharacterized protein YecT (DUF1311 family)
MTARFAAAGLLLWLLSASAMAGPMLPAGPSPEAGLAGVWRVIGAKPAPWSKLHKLTRKEAPLLEYAVDFANGEVRGPAPVSCKSATYSSGVTYRDEAFGGALARSKDSGALAKAWKLSSPQLSTFRIYCGEPIRDFYFDDNADLVAIVGEVIYTLERPTGMDPQQYQAGYSGPSFDCSAAKTTGERLVCIDAQLSKSDKSLGEAYSALRRDLSPESFATFAFAQRAWLAYVMQTCGANVPMPATFGDRNVIVDCLRPEYYDRVNIFSGLKAEKAGTVSLEPRMRFRARAKLQIQETDIYPWMSPGPHSARFNAFVYRILSLDRWRTDNQELFRREDVGQIRLAARRDYSLARFDKRIVSFQVSSDDYTGGNHGVLTQRSFTWDLVKSRLITLDEIFVADRDWKVFVGALCKEELHKQFSEREAPDVEDSEIAETIADGRNWLWRSDQAAVVFLVGTIGGLTGGEFNVDIPLAALKPYMKSDAPVR